MSAKKPWLLFTCNEETGGLGASCFCHEHKDKNLPEGVDDIKLLVEIDRRESNDAVYYDCDNTEFEQYITSKGFQTAYGSFSDISYIAPELGIAAVNLSSGYYNPHTLYEYINRRELNTVLEKVVEIVADATKDDFPKYVYVEKPYESLISYDDWISDYGDIRNKKITEALTDDEFFERKKLPTEYEQIYDELLDIYSVEELENYRELYGNEIIYQIYVDEFGPFYAEYER